MRVCLLHTVQMNRKWKWDMNSTAMWSANTPACTDPVTDVPFSKKSENLSIRKREEDVIRWHRTKNGFRYSLYFTMEYKNTVYVYVSSLFQSLYGRTGPLKLDRLDVQTSKVRVVGTLPNIGRKRRFHINQNIQDRQESWTSCFESRALLLPLCSSWTFQAAQRSFPKTCWARRAHTVAADVCAKGDDAALRLLAWQKRVGRDHVFRVTRRGPVVPRVLWHLQRSRPAPVQPQLLPVLPAELLGKFGFPELSHVQEESLEKATSEQPGSEEFVRGLRADPEL